MESNHQVAFNILNIKILFSSMFNMNIFLDFVTTHQTFPWVVPLGTTLPKSQESCTKFKKLNSIYLYIDLFDWNRLAMCSPLMHTFMKNNGHPKTYNMHLQFGSNPFLTHSRPSS